MTNAKSIAAAAAILGLVAITTQAQATSDPPSKASPSETASKIVPDATVSGVTVTGEKDNPVVNKASQYVREHLPANTFTQQYPRFHDPICVKVQGLPDEFNRFIAKRVVEVAVEANAVVSRDAECKANVHVVFDNEPQALLTDVAKRRTIILGFYWNERQLKEMATFKRPIESWYVTRLLDTNDNSRLEQHDPTSFLDPPHGRAGSRLGSDMRADLMHTLILADSRKVANEKIGTVADYIAVLALAKWQGVEKCNALPTILNLMADGCDAETSPETATAADIGLLKGLYSAPDRASGSQQRMEIASRIESEMKRAATEPQ